MIAPLWQTLALLRWWSMRGWATRTRRLAKNPRYAVGLLAGIAYFAWFVGQPLFFGGGFSLGKQGLLVREGVHLIGATLIGLYVSVSWLLSRPNPLLKLRSADFHMLLPAPIPRRTLLSFVLLQQLPKLLLVALFLGLFLSSAGSPLDRLRHTAGLMLFFVAWDLYGKSRGIFKARLKEWSPLLLNLTQILAGVLAVGIVASMRVGVLRFFEALRLGDRGSRTFWNGLIDQLPHDVFQSPLSWTLKPFWFLTAARLSSHNFTALASAVFGVGLIAALFFLLIRANPGFHEFQVTSAPTREGWRAQRYQRRSPRSRKTASFRLAPQGRPEFAIWWKHTLATMRVSFVWIALGACGVLLLLTLMVAGLGAPRGLTNFLISTGILMGFMFPFFSGISARSGFVRDLRHLEAVRTWPVPARRMALGQSMHSALVGITGSVFAFLVALAAFAGAHVLHRGTGASPLPNGLLEHFTLDPVLVLLLLLVSLLPILSSVAFLSSQLEGVTGLFLPGWLMMGERRRGDPAAFGTRIIYSVAFFVALSLGLIPTGIMVVGLVLLAHQGWAPPIAIYPLLGLVLALPLMVETFGLVTLGGRLWRNLDPSQEVLEGFE